MRTDGVILARDDVTEGPVSCQKFVTFTLIFHQVLSAHLFTHFELFSFILSLLISDMTSYPFLHHSLSYLSTTFILTRRLQHGFYFLLIAQEGIPFEVVPYSPPNSPGIPNHPLDSWDPTYCFRKLNRLPQPLDSGFFLLPEYDKSRSYGHDDGQLPFEDCP
jgi:hypothetical protein